jgi:hypothetical protein
MLVLRLAYFWHVCIALERDRHIFSSHWLTDVFLIMGYLVFDP